VSAQNTNDLITLQSKAVTYYNQGDYSNAIIVYENLLAEQELAFGKQNMHVAETLSRLGEMCSLADMPDIANYYFNEAINIFQDSFQSRKNDLELPLLNLLQIYFFQNDTLMMQNIEQQLQSISTIFQSPNSIYPEFPFYEDTLIFPEEDHSFDMINLGLSYLDHGLYSEAAIQFNMALDNKTDNLDLHFFMNFFPNDSFLVQNMINAFSFQLDSDTTGASYFYLALFNNLNEKT
jgi:tetratricopeptide (TPR) repeat protein